MSKIYTEVSPCRDCQKRGVGCHSTCIDYIDWKASGIERPNTAIDRRKRGKTTWDKFYKHGENNFKNIH